MVERLNGIQEVGSSNLLPSTKSWTPRLPKAVFYCTGPALAYTPPPCNQSGVLMILAYIDPGSGSILIQVILASCIGGIAVFWNKVKALFTRKNNEAPKNPE